MLQMESLTMACRQKQPDKQHSGRQPKLFRDGSHRDNFGEGIETLPAVFDKTAFDKFKISNNFKQNIDETHSKQLKAIGKSIPAYGF
jgi:hypothetical protein